MVVNSPAEVHDLLTHRGVGAMFRSVRLRTILIFGLVAGVLGQERQPWLGVWSLRVTQPARYKRVTSQIEPWNDGLKVTYEMVGVRGGITHWEWTGRFDGKDYPVQGADTVLTNAYRKIDDRSYEIVIKVDGNVAAVSRVMVSGDGKTLQVTTEERIAGGKTVKTAAEYDRK
jgi:hypothetical protein